MGPCPLPPHLEEFLGPVSVNKSKKPVKKSKESREAAREIVPRLENSASEDGIQRSLSGRQLRPQRGLLLDGKREPKTAPGTLYEARNLTAKATPPAADLQQASPPCFLPPYGKQ